MDPRGLTVSSLLLIPQDAYGLTPEQVADVEAQFEAVLREAREDQEQRAGTSVEHHLARPASGALALGRLAPKPKPERAEAAMSDHALEADLGTREELLGRGAC